MKKFIQEFKEFINRGNVVDMAVGIMIGAAFKAIVDSLVNDILSPFIGLIFQRDFSDLAINIFGVSLKYGAFIMALINFLIIAFVLFVIIKMMNTLNTISFLKKKEEEAIEEAIEEAAAPTTKVCPFCKSEIAIDATRCPHCTSALD